MSYPDLPINNQFFIDFSLIIVYFLINPFEIVPIMTVIKPIPTAEKLILLADDDEVIRTMGRDILHILGYEVILAANGEETVSLYAQNQAKIGVVLLDWHMPGLTGLEILEKLWAVNKAVKVILATGLGQPREMEAIRKTGHTVALLQKPYLVKDLQSEISHLLEK